MSDWPTQALLPNVTIHSHSHESVGIGIKTALTSGIRAAASAVWPTANLAIYVPFAVFAPIVVVKAFVYNGLTVSGNFDIGIYDAAFRRLVSSGSVVQSGTSALQEVDIVDTLLAPGVYSMALVFDNITATTFRNAFGNAILLSLLGILQQATAFPLPAVATPATIATNYIPVFGFTTRTVV